MSRRLVLFDIDGTLVSAGRISARVFGEALLSDFSDTGASLAAILSPPLSDNARRLAIRAESCRTDR